MAERLERRPRDGQPPTPRAATASTPRTPAPLHTSPWPPRWCYRPSPHAHPKENSTMMARVEWVLQEACPTIHVTPALPAACRQGGRCQVSTHASGGTSAWSITLQLPFLINYHYLLVLYSYCFKVMNSLCNHVLLKLFAYCATIHRDRLSTNFFLFFFSFYLIMHNLWNSKHMTVSTTIYVIQWHSLSANNCESRCTQLTTIESLAPYKRWTYTLAHTTKKEEKFTWR